MSTAYFIMVHHKPDQFEWLMNAIYDANDLFLVHVDLKSRLGIKRDRRGLMREVRRICAGKPNVVLMRSRFTNWGGWSLSKILLDAMRIALKRDARWSHFVNLSGQCYPLKPLDRIKRELGEGGERLYVELRPLDSLPEDDWHRRMSAMFETPLRALKLPFRRAAPRGFSLTHKGSQWVILPRSFCQWAVAAPLTRRVGRYMRHLLLTDELLIQALATNGPFAGQIAPDYGRAIIWPGPKLLTILDLPYLLDSGAWFGRKFDATRDVAILDALAARNGFTSGPRLGAAEAPVGAA